MDENNGCPLHCVAADCKGWTMTTRKGKQRGNGEGGLILRGRLWHAQYYIDGRQIRTSTKTHVKAEAVAFLRKLMDSRDKGEVPTTDIRKLKYADLRQALIDDYVAKGNK